MRLRVFLPLFLVLACGQEQPRTEEPIAPGSTEAVDYEGYLEDSGIYHTDGASFVVRFPPGKVEYEKSFVSIESGKVDYHTYVHATPEEQDMMVSLSVYPTRVVDQKGPESMLEDAFKGIARGLGEYKVDMEEDFTLNALPCKRFMINNGDWYLSGEQLMIRERLYQKVVLKQGEYAGKSITQPFFESFHLLD